MTKPANLNFRQTLEGMTLIFDPVAAGDLDAVLQFNVSGAEPGDYYMKIANQECTFHCGVAANPSLTISTPSEVWLKISNKELDGMPALMQGLYTVNGDLSLLMRLNELFSQNGQVITTAANPNPPGPISLSGMAWMQVALAPWVVFWVFFGPQENLWLGAYLPLLLSLAILVYRARYGGTTLLEVGSAAFFAVAGVLASLGVERFLKTGSLLGSLFLAALWFYSLYRPLPLCGEYSKWSFVRPLWRNSMFIYPNAVIALVWGWQFILSVVAGVGAASLPSLFTVLTVVRYLLLIPAIYFTADFQKRADKLRVDDFEKTIQRLRGWTVAGLAVTVIMAVWIWVFLGA